MTGREDWNSVDKDRGLEGLDVGKALGIVPQGTSLHPFLPLDFSGR